MLGIAGFLAGIMPFAMGASAQAAPDDAAAKMQIDQANKALEDNQPKDPLIARGKYLATVGDCSACHSAKDGRDYAGGQYMPTPFGPISTPNITPDKETGIGDWTDDQFVRLFHEGLGKNGEHIYPVMPYPWFTKVSRDDALAIKAYLFSLQPVHAPRLPNHLAFPFNVRAGLAVWDQLFLKEGVFKPDPSKSAEINRGAYLVEGLGHCGECHNGRNLLGDTQMAQSLRGGPIQDWYAPNITSDMQNGIGKYSDDQVFSFLKTGVAPGMGVVAGPMSQTVHESLSKLTDADVHAIVAYLKSTPAEPSYTGKQDAAFTGPQAAGAQVYLNNCASCHQLDGKGIGENVPSLVNNGAVLANGPEDVIRVILSGIEAQATYAPMPAVSVGMTDQQIADVTNYVRQSWGNKAPANAGPGTVGKLRATSFSAMNIGPNGHCDTVVQPDLARVINDPKSGIMDALRSMTLENVLQTAGQVVSKVKAAAPQAKRADIVNSLTIAYCPIVQANSTVAENQKVAELDNFSERVYSELQTAGKE
ncbi:c-type cytochrome [Rhodopila sp.]|uniref:c-type cytochrome n=1 Tax=Rhodopila sp. TaxID=2480087 RepID=UPI003D0EDCE3